MAFLPMCLFSQVKIGQTTYETLDAACEASVNGDVVTIAGKTTLLAVYGIKKSITVRGITANAQITFGPGDVRLGFEGSNTINIENLTIVGVPRSQRQMWIQDNCHVIFKNDTIRDCYNTGPTDEHGGAFLMVGTSTLEAHNSVFINNKCSKNSGVFWLVEQSNVKLYDCFFTGNKAQYQGTDGKGGVFACVDSPHIIYAENCAFIGNSSEGNGGAFWIEGQNNNVKFVNCTFTKNTAGGHGGAISFWDKGTADLINCTVYQNSVTNAGGGGAVYLNWANNTVNMYNTVLTSNGYDDGMGNSGPSNIEGAAENAPFTVTANNSYYTKTEDGSITTNGANSVFTGATLLNDVNLAKGIYWNSIAAKTSVLVGLGNPDYLKPYSSTDQRGWNRIMTGKICAGAYELDATVYDSVVVKKQIKDQEISSPDVIRVSFNGSMEVYLVPPTEILGMVEYDVASSDNAIVTATLDLATKEIVLTRKTKSAANAIITLTGYSPKTAYNQIKFNVKLIASNAIHDLAANKLKIYANPATDYLYFSGDFATDINISIYDLAGKTVMNTDMHKDASKVNVSSLTSGIFFIKITDKNGAVYSQRFIKK